MEIKKETKNQMADLSKLVTAAEELKEEERRENIFLYSFLQNDCPSEIFFASDYDEEDEDDMDDDFVEEDEELFNEDDLIEEGYEEDFDFDEEEDEDEEDEEEFGRYN